MKSGKVLFSAILGIGLLGGSSAMAQRADYVRQVVTVNSGKFEYLPPFADHVTVQAFNPQSGAVNPFGTIYTQSGQAIVISGATAFVAAQDSIVKFDLNTMQRLGAVRDSGLAQIALAKGALIVSKQYPVVSRFVEVLDTATLGVIARIEGISGDCGGITLAGDTVYVAVNGGWMGTGGKLAVIDPATWTLKTEVDLGAGALGISSLFAYNGKVVSVNKTPYGVTGAGSVTLYNPADRTFNNVPLAHTIGMGTGVKGNLLYLMVDNGIGSFNLSTLAVEEAAIIPDPGSSLFRYFTSAVLDTLDNRIYANIGDYITSGTCLVTTLAGDSVTSFATGISSDAVAIDYRSYPAGLTGNHAPALTVQVYPNPVTELLQVSLGPDCSRGRMFVIDAMGRVVLSAAHSDMADCQVMISCGDWPAGLYHLVWEASGKRAAVTFVKR